MSKRYKLKRRQRRQRRQRSAPEEKHHRTLCAHEGCHARGRSCYLNSWDEVPHEYFCPDHAHDAGYCRCCGQFWGGITSFDLSRSGLCEQCQDQVDADFNDTSDPEECWND